MGFFFLVYLTKSLSKCPNSTKPLYWKRCGCTLGQNSLLSHSLAYSETVSNIQSCSGILRDIKAYLSIFKHYWGIIKNIRTLSLCIYNRAIFRTLAFLEPEASSESCRTCKIIMHIQSPCIVRTVYSNVFKDTLEYTGILMEIQPYFLRWTREEKGGFPSSFWKSKQSVLIFE